MTFIEETTATLVDVAKRANMTVDEVKAEAAALGFFIGQNWAHEESLAARDAFSLLDGSARRNHDHEAAWRQHTLALEQWQRDRELVRRQAFDVAWQAAVRAGHGSHPATEEAHQAARDAVAVFDKAKPEPVFREPPESRMQTLIRRVKAGTR